MPIYKLLSKADWEESQALGYVKPSSYDNPFIHMCEQQQIADIMSKINSDDVMILEIDTTLLQGKLIKEANKPGGIEYWHLYDNDSQPRKIPLNAVINTQLRIKQRPTC